MPHVAYNSQNSEPSSSPGGHRREGRVRWLVSSEDGGARRGAVAEVILEPGSVQPLHRHRNADEAAIVLEGDAILMTASGERPLAGGTLALSPRGVWHGIGANENPVKLLLIYGGESRASELETEYGDSAEVTASDPEPQTVSVPDAVRSTRHDPAAGFYEMSAAWLVGAQAIPCPSVVVGKSAYGADGREGGHALHRHHHAEEWAYIVDGQVNHLTEDGKTALSPGDFIFVPPEEWHGIWNPEPEAAHAVFGYLGIDRADAAGYELREVQPL